MSISHLLIPINVLGGSTYKLVELNKTFVDANKCLIEVYKRFGEVYKSLGEVNKSLSCYQLLSWGLSLLYKCA